MSKVTIIGGGIGGLATAALLAKDGFSVTLIEKNKQLGGRARFFEDQGFKFDMGPSWYMMPDVFEQYFALFDKKPSDFYELMPVDPRYSIFLSSGKKYTITNSLDENIKLFEQIEPSAGEKFKQFLAASEYKYTMAMKSLVKLDYTSLRKLLQPELILQIHKMNLFQSYHDYIQSYFKNTDLQKILEFMTVFLGGSPYNTPAFYSLVAHTDFNLKVWHPKGGLHTVIDALETLCRQHKVHIQTDETVKKIEISNKSARTVVTNRNTYESDFVVCNADYHFGETSLLETKYQTYTESYWQKKTLAPSSFLIYVGITGKLPTVDHHNLFFDTFWDEHYDTVYKKPSWPDKPSYYIHAPSRTDKTMAPEDSETLIFLVPVAAGLEDTDEIRNNFVDKILSHFENLVGVSIRNRIVVKHIYSHRNFISDYNAYKGSAFGLAHTLTQTAFLRPLNKSKKIQNLYYVGQYTNPGVGLPPCLISAQIVHNLITHAK